MKGTARRRLGLVLIAVGCIILGGCSPRMPMLNAAGNGDLVELKMLLQQGQSINERDPRISFGWTPLIAAIYHHNTNVVHFLIASGADVNIPDNSGETAIMWAMGGGDDNLSIVKDLIAHGADLNAKDKGGASVLSYASSAPPKPKLLEAVKAALAKQGQAK